MFSELWNISWGQKSAYEPQWFRAQFKHKRFLHYYNISLSYRTNKNEDSVKWMWIKYRDHDMQYVIAFSACHVSRSRRLQNTTVLLRIDGKKIIIIALSKAQSGRLFQLLCTVRFQFQRWLVRVVLLFPMPKVQTQAKLYSIQNILLT